MPKMNGIEATREIKARYPDVTVVGLSVNVDGGNQVGMLGAGAALWLTKEAAVEELYEVIMRHVGRASESETSHQRLPFDVAEN